MIINKGEWGGAAFMQMTSWATRSSGMENAVGLVDTTTQFNLLSAAFQIIKVCYPDQTGQILKFQTLLFFFSIAES